MKIVCLSLALVTVGICAEPSVLQQAMQEGLPLGPFRSLIAEAQAKQVPPAELDAALQRRLTALRAAKAIILECGYGKCPAPQQQELMVAVGRAMESRVPTEALRQALKAGEGSQTMRLQAAVEAGETLKLLGLDDPTVGTLMYDFVVRKLGRGEILRAVQFVSQQYRAGIPGPTIRDQLWNNTTTNQPRTGGGGTSYGKGRGRR